MLRKARETKLRLIQEANKRLLNEQPDNSREENLKKIASILKKYGWKVEIGEHGIDGSNNKLPSFGVGTDNTYEDGNCIMFEVYKEFYFDPIHICYKDDTQFKYKLRKATKNMEDAMKKNK